MTLNYLQVCEQLSALVVWYFSCIIRVLCNCSIGVLFLKPAYTVNFHSAPRLAHILGAVVRCYRRPDLFPGRKWRLNLPLLNLVVWIFWCFSSFLWDWFVITKQLAG